MDARRSLTNSDVSRPRRLGKLNWINVVPTWQRIEDLLREGSALVVGDISPGQGIGLWEEFTAITSEYVRVGRFLADLDDVIQSGTQKEIYDATQAAFLAVIEVETSLERLGNSLKAGASDENG